MTQVAVAAKMQVSQGWVSKVEKMDSPPLEAIVEYLQALGGQLTLQVKGLGDKPLTLPIPA